MEEQDKDSFIVKDKRRFTDAAEGAGEGAKEEIKTGEESTKAAQGHQQEVESHDSHVEINFASFVFSIASSAFIHLGEEPDPVSGEQKISLPMAKQTIDVLTILEEKTKGNLTKDEDQLLKNLLYALRMRYVEAVSKK